MKYQVVCYMRVDPDPESVVPLSYCKAQVELEQAQEMHPNDLFKIEKLEA